jgi:hypothetical protein
LALALVAIVLLEGFAALALLAASARYRLAGDSRVAVEGDLLAASRLANARIAADSAMRRLPDGGRVTFALERHGGWEVSSAAARRGALIELSAAATLRDRSGAVSGMRRATLLLVLVAADTLRVSGYRSRF